jgi:hypothetical protein
MDWKGPHKMTCYYFDALMGAHHIELAALSGYLWAGYCQKRSKAWHHRQHDHSIAIDRYAVPQEFTVGVFLPGNGCPEKKSEDDPFDPDVVNAPLVCHIA